MFNGDYTPVRREDPSPSNLRSQAMNTTNNLSASVPGPASGVHPVQLEGTHIDFSQLPQHLLTPLIEGAFQYPQLQRNPQAGGVYNAGPSHEPNLGNTTATGGGDVPVMPPYGGPPPTLPNVPQGQAGTGDPATSFQVADQPPTMPWRDLHPDVFARPNEQGHGPLWRLVYAALDYEGGDDLRVVIHFRKIRSPS